MESWLSSARRRFHIECLAGPISTTNGIPSIADVASKASREISKALLIKIGASSVHDLKPAGQSSGAMFEIACKNFIEMSFSHVSHLRPGEFHVERGRAISSFVQYAHLDELRLLAAQSRELKTHLGTDYLIKPDVIVTRSPLTDDAINREEIFVDRTTARNTPLRAVNSGRAILHASISCKLTIRSDRVQNTRSEALNLVRNRKGRLPHIIAVTAEPLPARIAAIALGTGDIDCVYHFALYELLEVLAEQDRETLELVETMIDGQRLRDISDLPLDLAI